MLKQWGQVPVSTATFDGKYYPMSFYFSFKSDHLSELQEIEDEGDIYESIEDIWPDYPTKEDFLFNEDEY